MRTTDIPPDSAVSQETIRAYLETHYHVHGAEPFTLQPEKKSPELAAMLLKHRVDCCAYITAYNPFSRMLDENENSTRQAALATELKQAGYAFQEGIGRHPSGNWAGEPSFAVFGMPLQTAKNLGIKYEQNALLWCDADATPQLILLR